jgi:chemotaxis signal transduction protein
VSGLSADALRDAFDGAFAREPAEAAAGALRYLAIRQAGDPYAVPLDAVAGLVRDVRITSLPTASPDFIGVTALAGRPVPVFDLRRLMGHAPAAAPRVVLLVRAPEALGLAVDDVDGQFAAEPDDANVAAGPGAHVRGAVANGARVLPVVDLASVIAAVRRQCGPGRPGEER